MKEFDVVIFSDPNDYMFRRVGIITEVRIDGVLVRPLNEYSSLFRHFDRLSPHPNAKRTS